MPQTPDPLQEAVSAALADVIDQHALGDTPDPERLAQAALAAIPVAEMGQATLYTLRLDHVDREEAVFNAAGGFALTMHRGEWMERGRPAQVWITVQEVLTAA